ncbi:hypothetical protein SCE1572_11570 [Sorangium cellulosum So0157-2]|uniref:DUF2252 domain-containing protein n=2 Tax=Sorangium cellulosum TaxID=56 RepID=S4XRE9_SORCE|nr:hypothetical protein SCE1572_11570 [Sorangium cellulosum So0157-2]
MLSARRSTYDAVIAPRSKPMSTPSIRALVARRPCAAAAFSAVALAAAPGAAASSRTSYIVAEITSANAGLPSSARAEKYAEMKASPFTFFRGSNHLYWKDLGSSPQLLTYGGASSTRTWLGGDMHVNNMGSFDDDQGDVVYAINDFDEAVIGDYQLDVWRLATSLALVARENGGYSLADQSSLLDAFTEAYLDAIASYAGNSQETTRKFTESNTYGLLDDFLDDVEASNSRVEMLDDFTIEIGGVRALDTGGNPDLAPVSAAVDADVRGHMSAYRATLSGGGSGLPAAYFAVKSVAQRLHSGIGSLGVTRYYVLIEGPTAGQDDDRLLDVKAQGAPSAFAGIAAAAVSQTSAASGGNHATRTVLAYKALGYRVDDLLGWMTLSDGQSYSVRERSPYKDTFDTASLSTMTRFTNLAQQWGEILATQHARADDDWDAAVFSGSVDVQIDALTDGDHAGFRAKVRAIALDYADQVALDYTSFCASF